MDAANFDKILRKVVIVPVAALLAGAIALAWQIRQANDTVALIETSDQRIALTLTIEQLVIDQETGLRGYQITHDPHMLDRYHAAEQALPAAFDRRRQLAVRTQRVAELNEIQASYDTWHDGFAVPLLDILQAGGDASGLELNERGRVLMDAIRQRIHTLNDVTIQNRDRAVLRWRQQVQITLVALLVVAIALGLIIGLYVRRLLHQVSAAFRQSNNALRLRAEQTFRSEERLRTTLRSIGEGVITCDIDGKVQSLNDAAQEMTGWSEADARELPIPHIFPIHDEATGETIENPVLRVTRSNRIVRLENHTTLTRRDGSRTFIEDSAAPIRDKNGNLIGVVLVFRDVSIAKKSQEALLANEKLAVAGRLAATIAHEIHNPLDSVSNLLFLMDGVATAEEREQFLQLARQEIARVTQISRAMLSLYRESRAPVEVDLKEMIDSLLLLMDGRFTALGVSVSQQIPEGLLLHGFPAELRQVFTNLLTNAAEATGSGGTIHIAATQSPASLLITLKDDGPGVPPDVLGQLFQPFFTTKGELGTGLGLWVSRGIVTRHGGTLELTSSTAPEHHGTTVSIVLPTQP